jgi:hypothetical protein
MGIFSHDRWEPVFDSESEAEARIILGLLKGHELAVKMLGDPTEPYNPQPAIRGMAGRWGRFMVLVPESDLERARNIIQDYMTEDTSG